MRLATVWQILALALVCFASEPATVGVNESSTWAILADGEKYLHGALTLAQSLIDTGTRFPILVVTTQPVDPKWVRALGTLKVSIERMAPMSVPGNLKIRFKHWIVAMQKIKLMDHLQHYRKVAILDADSLVLHNIDEVMSWPTLSASTNLGWGCRANIELVSNLMVFEPDRTVFNRLYQFMSVPTYHARVDQAILESFFSQPGEAGVHFLPSKFMCFVKACRCSPDVVNVSLEQSGAVMYSEKPWEVREQKLLFHQGNKNNALDWDLSCPWTGDYTQPIREYRFDTPDRCSAHFYCRWFDTCERALKLAGLPRPDWW